MTSVAVYTCAVGKYDWIHPPRVMPPGIDFLRYSDKRPWLAGGWQHRPLPAAPGARTARAVSRFPKLRPQSVLDRYDIAVWIDSNIVVVGDLTPMVRTFQASGADIALFPHPSGRTVAEEMAFAIEAGRVPLHQHDIAPRQLDRYKAAGVLDHRVVEASIIFYRLSSETLSAACEIWWHEVVTYVERDQVSQPYAMRDPRLQIHLWDWHFKQPNQYFRRLPHRPSHLIKRLRTGAHELGDSRLDYRLVRHAIRGAKELRRLLSRE